MPSAPLTPTPSWDAIVLKKVQNLFGNSNPAAHN